MNKRAAIEEHISNLNNDAHVFDIVFSGPPSHEAGRFVEIEDICGCSMNVGTWIEREDGYWALRITQKDVSGE